MGRGKPPLLLLLASLLLLLALLQLGQLAVFWQSGGPLNSPGLQNLFADLPQAKQASQAAPTEPQPSQLVVTEAAPAATAISWPAQPHNPRQGSATAKDVLVIATDSCRPTVAALQDRITQQPWRYQVVYKYLPHQAEALDAGMLQQLAYRQGYFEQYWQILCGQNLAGLPAQVKALEQAGMSLSLQRAAMASHLTDIVKELNADIRAAENMGLTERPLPIFILNGRVVESSALF